MSNNIKLHNKIAILSSIGDKRFNVTHKNGSSCLKAIQVKIKFQSEQRSVSATTFDGVSAVLCVFPQNCSAFQFV